MKVHYGIDKIPIIRNPVITIGTFDGVHAGHRKIIERLIALAEEIKGESVIITFHPHPRIIVNPKDTKLRLLNTLEEKIELIEQYKINHLVVVPFTIAFSNLTAQQYIRDFLVGKFHPKKLVIGHDHHFGNNREGNINLHKKLAPQLGYEIDEIPSQLIENIAISSTKIRKALDEGNVKKASALLGYNYFLQGEVIKGKQIGVELGFPTANILVNNNLKLIPANGVYAVKVHHDKKIYNGMLNIGLNPTFNGNNQSIEVNIFDFNKNIYGQTIRMEFISFLRSEERFQSVEQLINQLRKDRGNTIKLLSL